MIYIQTVYVLQLLNPFAVLLITCPSLGLLKVQSNLKKKKYPGNRKTHENLK